MSNINLKGVGVALVTPFDENGVIDFNQYEKLCNYVIENKVDYVVVLGTTGEVATMNDKERHDLIRATVNVVNKRVPVVAGFGGNYTQKIAEELNAFDLSGVDAILSVSPYYNKPTQDGLYEHYKTIAKSTELPLILYNVPGRTSSNIKASTTLKLAENFSNIIAIKEATSDWSQIIELAHNKPDNFYLLSGNDDLIVPQISLGYDGVISVMANATPKLFAEMVHLAMDNNFVQARKIVFDLDELINMMFEQGNPAGVKCALHHLGICSENIRLPLMPVSEDLSVRIQAKLKNLGL
jgi:4-hydroxy-tetrahydrodipicolinate synthase